MPQRPVRRNVPQGAHNTPNTAARDRALQAEEMRKKRYYRRKRRAENLAYALRIFLLVLGAALFSRLLPYFLSSAILQSLPTVFPIR